MEDGEIVEAIAMEETQAKNGKSPFVVLQESKTAVEEIVLEILSIKRDNKPKSLLPELVTQIFLHFVSLRQANRSILVEEDRMKAETERAKALVDSTTLQLHNLMYEKSHYLKAIKACKDFKSKYPDIDLVPEEEFFRDAPDDIKAATLSEDASHDLMLKRLNYELHQRKELCKMKEQLEARKKVLLETITNRKKFLSSLPSHLKALKKASVPVQNQLGILHTKKLKQQNSAELLPPSLYVIFSQLLAQKEAFGENIDLEIVGSLKDAVSFARQQANKDADVAANAETLRLEDDAVDDEDDGQRRRKRPKRAPTKESLDQEGVYQVHPLKVILHIYNEEAPDTKSDKLITLRFEYMVKLNVVCAGVEGSQEGPERSILWNLFPDDAGIELPHQLAKLLVGHSRAFDESRTSRPYKWTQHLAGIDFLPEAPPLLGNHESSSSGRTKHDVVVSGLSLYRQQNRVQTVVQRIRSRKKAQLALVEQLDSLAMLKWPSLKGEDVPWALHSPSCDLYSWSQATLQTTQAPPTPISNTNQVREMIDLNMDANVGSPKEELHGSKEDGELPSLNPGSTNNTPSRVAGINHLTQLTLISKSIISPISKAKSQSSKKLDDDSEMLLDVDSDNEDLVQSRQEDENAAGVWCHEMAKNAWMDHGVRECCLVLSRKSDAVGRHLNLEAKVKISIEYPLRPPLFSLNLYSIGNGGNQSGNPEWCNELRAMEAEVNVYILKLIHSDKDNYILAHQVRCLAMLFDYLMEESSSDEKRTNTSVVDIGLCKPVSGRLLSRSFRGRDHRRMISWKEMECTYGYPS